MNFSEFLASGRITLDGAMGTELIKKGYRHSTEILNVENIAVLTEIHRGYVEAGSDIVCANTFNCNAKKANLSKYNLEQLIFGAVQAARAAMPKYVLYDCGPIGELLYPDGRLSFQECYELFREQAILAEKSGCDGVIIETMGDLRELKCAVLAFKENTALPVLCSMSFEENGRTFWGVDGMCFALTAQALGAEAVGINCGIGPDKAIEVVKKIVSVAKVPVFAKPNAGMPIFKEGRTYYDMDAECFAEHCLTLAKIGVSILGGCCGTDSEYIYLLKKAVSSVPVKKLNNGFDGLCSYANTARFGEKTLIIGERVNPTNKPLLKQAIKDCDYNYILGMCVEQAAENADVLDINVGMAGIDEAAILEGAITETQGVAALPFCIDTAKKTALERALRVTAGIPLINSVTGEKEAMERVFPLAKKYGAYVVALLLDENGIPESAAERLAIAEKIANFAKEYGLSSDRLLYDPLTMALSVNSDNGKILLNLIEELKNRGYKTVLGLSNISYGLPNRNKLNGALLNFVKKIGVTAVIVNPSLRENEDPDAIELLTGGDKNCEKYIEKNSAFVAEEPINSELNILECVVRGLTGEGMRILKKALTPECAGKIIEDEIIGGLNKLGERYEEGKVFLPALIAGSETAKAMLDYIKIVCFAEEGRYKATVLIATVKGDVHDIGKNIVKTVAANYGYRMIDLGRDVPAQRILAAAEQYKPQAVALSALMTTTLDNMTETVLLLKEKFPSTEILVGGAVVTAEYADSVGAHYSRDAREACVVLEKLFAD